MDANIPKLIPRNTWGVEYKIKDLALKPAIFIEDNMTCRQVIKKFKEVSNDQFPVKCHKTGEVIGMMTSTILMSKLANAKLTIKDTIKNAVSKDFRNMTSSMPLSEVSRVLEKQAFVFVDQKYIVSNFDLLNFIDTKQPDA